MDDFPIIDRHCGVGIHDFQTPARIATIVKPAIAAVAGMNDVFGLADYAANYLKPPEARLFAAAKVEAAHAIATDERRVRPDVDLEKVRASVAGLRDLRHRHRHQALRSGQYPLGDRPLGVRQGQQPPSKPSNRTGGCLLVRPSHGSLHSSGPRERRPLPEACPFEHRKFHVVVVTP